MPHDHAPTDWAVSVAGLCISAWQWITAGMSPLAALVAILSVVLAILRIRESIERRRLMAQFGTTNRGVLRRIADALATKPAEWKD